jgi:DNA-binding NarL/FixJ family response regulator
MYILLADCQPKVRFALRVLLDRQPGLESVGEAVDAEGLLAKMAMTHPDLVLLSWELPGLAEVGSISALRRVCTQQKVIVLSGRTGVRKKALAAGADAFVSKTDPPERLLNAISELGQGPKGQADAEASRALLGGATAMT